MKMNMLAIETKFLQPLDTVSGFGVRPGFYEMNGATKLSCGVNFTIHSQNATSCELLLFHRGEKGAICGTAVSGALSDRAGVFDDCVRAGYL